MDGCQKQGKQDINPVAVRISGLRWTPDDVLPAQHDLDINLERDVLFDINYE